MVIIADGISDVMPDVPDVCADVLPDVVLIYYTHIPVIGLLDLGPLWIYTPKF
jgi:hypothetical protein